ncbi:MAG: enoyl-CoA hydratase [Alphaproteobacteria bacterium]|nr:enoyl-CoA hydratase [Alphaproteobacteria bacterium]MBM3655005.1 enoyl-CoA hydratase [Alphaproteobacteria bacterium]
MAILSPTPKLRVTVNFGVARLYIDNPSKRNAFDFEMWRALPALMRDIDAEEAARILVISGAPGMSFCAGADISEFATLRATSDGGRVYEKANVEAFDAISNLSKPTIAAVSGFCMGGGFGIAAACDLRVADARAVFAVPAAKLGVGYPPAAMAYVVGAVGIQLAFDLFYAARRLTAVEANERGFVSQLFAPESFEGGVHALAETIAAGAPLTLRAAKAAIRAAGRLPGAPSHEQCEALASACFDSDDYMEGRAAFLEKRAPRFSGR